MIYKYYKNYRFIISVSLAKRKLVLRAYSPRYGQNLLKRSNFSLPKRYKIAIGRAQDHLSKIREGDCRTPIGEYWICEKLILSEKMRHLGSRWFRLTYPNLKDIRNALKNGVINITEAKRLRGGYRRNLFKRIETPLGYGIGIHGTRDNKSVGKKSTDGCLRMTNLDVEELFEIVPLGTKVIIHQ